MCWPDLQVVGKFVELLNRAKQSACSGVGSSGHAGCFFEQVWSSDRADEHEVTGEDSHRLVGTAALVSQNERQTLRSVSRCVNDRQQDFADANFVAIFEQPMLILVDNLIFPIRWPFVG